jgi:hypothetical protein
LPERSPADVVALLPEKLFNYFHKLKMKIFTAFFLLSPKYSAQRTKLCGGGAAV